MTSIIDEIIRRNLTEQDYAVSATALMAREYLEAIGCVWFPNPIYQLLDLGCAYGGMALAAGEYLGAQVISGIDTNEERVKFCIERGINAFSYDLNNKIPFSSESVDVITCNGVIEHLNWYDDIITESKRVLVPGGYLVITWPNLANYIQRIALLRGYQPTDVCISRNIYAGTMYDAGSKDPERHMRSCTAGAMRQLLEYYGFEIVRLVGADPVLTGKYAKWAWALRIVGKLVPTTMARRLIVIARKP